MANWNAAAQQVWNLLERATTARNGHRITAKHFGILHRRYGMVAVVLSAATATALAASAQNTGPGRWTIAVMSAVAAVVGGVRTFAEYEKIAGRHETARSGYGSVCRDVEALLAVDEAERPDPLSELKRVNTRLDELTKLNAHVPERFYEQGKAEAAEQLQRLQFLKPTNGKS
jgi:hypothetical protein